MIYVKNHDISNKMTREKNNEICKKIISWHINIYKYIQIYTKF